MDEAGGLAGGADLVVDDINSIRHEQNVMKKIHKSLSKAGLKLPIPISETDHPDCEDLPWLSLCSWIVYLIKEDKLSHLYGGHLEDEIGDILRLFWTYYRRIEPDLKVYEFFDAGLADPATTIPMTSHQDEGRGIFDLN